MSRASLSSHSQRVTRPLTDGDQSTRNFYERFAAQYARETQTSAVPLIWNALEARLPRGARILDLGCGAGRDVRHFANEGFEIVGLERSHRLARIANEHSGQSIIIGDFRQLPFDSQSFDGVCAVASLLHLPREALAHVLQGIRRTLGPNGVFVASMKEGDGEQIDARGRFTTLFTQKELRSAMRMRGFDVLSVEPTVELRHGEKVNWLTIVAKHG